MSRLSDRGRHSDEQQEIKKVARLYDIEPSIFTQALHIKTGWALSQKAALNLERLVEASREFRNVIPDEYIPKWAHQTLPRLAKSPKDILGEENGLEHFVSLIEGIVNGDFA